MAILRRSLLLALALLFAPMGVAHADVVDYITAPLGELPSPLERGGVRATSSNGQPFFLFVGLGLGVVGGSSFGTPVVLIDGSESVELQFTAGPATEVSLSMRASTFPIQMTVRAWNAAGTELPAQTVTLGPSGRFDDNVAALFGNVPLSRFAISTPSAEGGLILNSLQFTTAPTPTPQGLIEDLADEVAALVEGGANLPANGQSLYSKLDTATAALLLGDPESAVGALGAFINQVEAFVKKGRLTQDEGDELFAAAEEIIELLSEPGCPV